MGGDVGWSMFGYHVSIITALLSHGFNQYMAGLCIAIGSAVIGHLAGG